MQKYKLLGKEELDWICDFCNRKEISICYTVEDMETGEILRFGSSCIKKALKISTKELTDMVGHEISAIKNKYFKMIDPIDKEMNDISDKYRKDNNNFIGMMPKTAIDYWNLVSARNELLEKEKEELLRYGVNFY